MRNKIISLLLVLVMAVAMFVSCSPTLDPDPTPDGDTTPCTNHVDANNDGKCDNCGKKMSTGGESGNGGDGGDVDSSFTWDTTNLYFQLTKNSNSEELSATLERYLAGEGDNSQRIDTMVKERNYNAAKYANVTVSYQYYPDTTNYAWGRAEDHIVTTLSSGSTDVPDVFCNFVYDMMAASLKGVFANLKTTTKENHFSFAKNRLYATQVGDDEGYMYEYMQSLTLNRQKMYLLSSDYFTDMVRAFYVVPVSVALFEGLTDAAHEEILGGDLDGNGKFDIDDFFQLVKNKDWTYDIVAKYSAKVYRKSESNTTTDMSLKDTLGFAVSTGGLSASGLLYSTPITIINRVWNDDKTDSTDTYPESNPDYLDFTSKLSTLFKSTGVMAVGAESLAAGYDKNDLIGIRTRFTENGVLFGGVICVGSLEYDAYQQMRENGGKGFAVVPVPLYTQDEDHTMPYTTQVHNIGRVGAIAKTTTKFAQCSAFLDYQSRNSENILEQYYTTTLTYGAAGGLEGNVDMLNLVRANVRSSFDKAYEDAIGFFYANEDENSDSYRWNVQLASAKYQLDDASVQYEKVVGIKQTWLNRLKNNTYGELPD